MAEPVDTTTTMAERVLELADAIPLGLAAVDGEVLRRFDPLMETAMLNRRNELHKEFPGENIGPMVAASALSSAVSAGIDMTGEWLYANNKKRRKWPIVALLVLAGGGAAAYFMKKRKASDEADVADAPLQSEVTGEPVAVTDN